MYEPPTIEDLLADSCSNPSDAPGWNIYTIHLHCVTYKVLARPLGDGKYDIVAHEKTNS